ncbi:hypothetical protein ACOQFO_00265 [Ureibacillus sp. MALMAid1270]|uniref:hypothetical protein n=1 Tax=Ureibacillus sp. MALMAid1270 TaxID=3411629 RepID=UPI003BA81BF3
MIEMISRKLYAAFLTSVIGFFIIPFFFYEFFGGYSLGTGLVVSIWTVPTLFIGGVLSSIAIEYHGENLSIWLSYLTHLGCAFICSLLFSILGFDLINTALIAFIYVTIFFIADLITKYYEERAKN